MRAEIEASALGPAELTDGMVKRCFRFEEDFIGFGGHFPGSPILPAVLQILMAQLLAEQAVGESLQFRALARAKFTQPLRPGDRIELKLNCQEKQGQYHCASELWLAEQRAANFTLVLGKETGR